jgi:hypothetical protein
MGFFDRFFAPPSRDQFAGLMADAIRKAGDTTGLRYDADEFRLVVEHGPTNMLYLTNAYAEYCASPKAGRLAVLRRFVRTWCSHRKDLPDSFEDARHDLLPGVRSRSYFELAPLRLRAEGTGETVWPYRVLAGCLGVGLIYDLPDSMHQIQQDTLNGWNASFDEALAAACENLRRISGQDFERPLPGVWLSPWRDNYDASRLAIPDVLRRYKVKGEMVAAVPHRDVLVLTGSEDEAGLGFLLSLIEERMEQPRPLSESPVQLDGETWLPFRPDSNSPLYERFRLLHIKSRAREYAEQAEVLNALHQKTGEDVFVASYTAIQKKDGKASSYCVWSAGVDTLLPRTDEVLFNKQDAAGKAKITARGAWDKVMEIAGSLCEPCKLYPERRRVRAFPTAEQLAAINDEGKSAASL